MFKQMALGRGPGRGGAAAQIGQRSQGKRYASFWSEPGGTLLLAFRYTNCIGAVVEVNGSTGVDMQQQQQREIDAVQPPSIGVK